MSKKIIAVYYAHSFFLFVPIDCASSIVSGSLVSNVSGVNRKRNPATKAVPKKRKNGNDSEYCA